MEANYRCVAVGCESSQSRLDKWTKQLCSQHKCKYGTSRCDCTPPFALYPFPTERTPADRENWKAAFEDINLVCNPNIDKSLRVCSKHFIAGKPTQTNPVPTLHLDSPASPSSPNSFEANVDATPSKKRRRSSHSSIMRSPRTPRSSTATPIAKPLRGRLRAQTSSPPTLTPEELDGKLKEVQQQNELVNTDSDSELLGVYSCGDGINKEVTFNLPADHKHRGEAPSDEDVSMKPKISSDQSEAGEKDVKTAAENGEINASPVPAEETSGEMSCSEGGDVGFKLFGKVVVESSPDKCEEKPKEAEINQIPVRSVAFAALDGPPKISDNIDDELHHFGGYIAAHMRHLPLQRRLEIQRSIVKLVLDERIT